MVQSDQQYMLTMVQPHQLPAQQRSSLQIESCANLFDHKTLQLCCSVTVSAQVVPLQCEPAVLRCNFLERLTIDAAEGGAQGFVTSDDAVERAAQRVLIQLAAQTQPEWDMVGGTHTLHLGQEPQPLLREGQRQRLVASG